jgi:hypothetical protein
MYRQRREDRRGKNSRSGSGWGVRGSPWSSTANQQRLPDDTRRADCVRDAVTQRVARVRRPLAPEDIHMLIYRSPRGARIHGSAMSARQRLSLYRMSLAIAAASAALACSSTSPKPRIGFDPGTITLTTVVGGTATGEVSVVDATASGTLSGLNAAVGAYSNNASGWLTATLTGGATPTPLHLAVNAGNLNAGKYSAVVNVSAAAASPPTATLTVNLTVSAQ